MPSYSLSPEAKNDLLTIRAYTQNKWATQQAQKYLEALEKCVRSQLRARSQVENEQR